MSCVLPDRGFENVKNKNVTLRKYTLFQGMGNRFYFAVLMLLAPLWGLAETVNVRDFGARGDGVSIDSPAFDAAITAACSKGRGVVTVPEGVYACYSIHLKSHVTLRLEKGAVIKAAVPTENQGFDLPEPNEWTAYQDFGHSHWQNSLLWGIGLEDVHIEGEGLIDGSGSLSRGTPRRGSTVAEANKALALKECKDVSVRGVSFLMCGHFAMLLTGVDRLTIDNVTVDTNRDGIDIDCCEHVSVTRCKVNTLNDDAIVLKCSYALGYLKPTAFVRVENCEVSGYDPGTFMSGEKGTTIEKAPDRDGPTGRVKLGTESNGGFHHITIRNCTFNHCRGLALETVDGARMEHIRVSRLRMDDIVNSPIYICVGDRMRGPATLPPSKAHDIRIKDVKVTRCDSRYALLISGLEGNCVEDVLLKDIDIEFKGGLTLEDVREQRNGNSFFRSLPQLKGYPEPSAHGIQPAWGASLHHVRNITFKRVNLHLLQPDEREKFYFEDARQVVPIFLGMVNLCAMGTSVSQLFSRRFCP